MADRDVVAAVLAGERDRFRELVERESTVVLRSCLRILGRVDEAEDVAQEAFVTAFRSLAGYRGDGPFGAWVVRIATRLALRRRSGRRPTEVLDSAGELRASGRSTDPLQAALSGETQAVVRGAVIGLAEPYREIVVLRFFGELSLQEIAAVTHRPVNTVKTQLRRGLERLRAELRSEVAA